jgi:hypothetical protein
MTDPTAGEVNAASFDATHDNVFSRIAARYDVLRDLAIHVARKPLES